MKDCMRICGGNAHPELTQSVFENIHTFEDCKEATFIPTENKQFADGETRVKIMDNTRGCHVYVIQPTCAPANDNFMELCIMMDALKRAGAEQITAVVPYVGYARQDKKVKPREPLTAKMCADFLQAAGMQRLITIDVHSPQHQAFYDCPVDNLYGGPIFGDYFFNFYYGNILNTDIAKNLCVVSPDAGGVGRATAMSKHLGCSTIIIDKNRPMPGVVGSMTIIGDVSGKECLIIDDMIDSGNTLITATDSLFAGGATKVNVVASHPVLSGKAAENLANSAIEHIVCLDTIPISDKKREILGSKLMVLSSADLLASAIARHYHGESVSSLFDNWGK